jgi:hypothetical protein
VPPAPAPLRAAIRDLTGIAVRNQGLLDKQRERSEAVHAVVRLRDAGFPHDPDALMVEAQRNQWGGTGPEDLGWLASAYQRYATLLEMWVDEHGIGRRDTVERWLFEEGKHVRRDPGDPT